MGVHHQATSPQKSADYARYLCNTSTDQVSARNCKSSRRCGRGRTRCPLLSHRRFISPSTMRTQNLAAPHGPKSVAFREFIAAAPYLNPSSQQVPLSSDITHGNDSLKYKDRLPRDAKARLRQHASNNKPPPAADS